MIDHSGVPLTCLITKGEGTPERFPAYSKEILDTVKRSIDSRISFIQVREKQISTRQLFELASAAAEMVSGSKTKLLINGRADVAMAAGAHGVHLPEDGVPVADVRRVAPPDFLIGASIHSLEAALSARSAGADLVVAGPVFDSQGKQGRGLAWLGEICKSLEDFPVLAVGGIDGSNYTSVLESGASGYAAIRYLNEFVGQGAFR